MSENGPSEPNPREALLQMVNACMISQALYVVAKLGVADLLADGPKSSDEIAKAVDCHPPSVYRVLRSVAGVGVFAEGEDGRFELTPMGDLLRSDTEDSVQGWTIIRGEPFVWRPWGEILTSVKTGGSAFNHVFGKGPFDYLGENQDVARMFDIAMRSISHGKYEAVAEAYDFSGVETLVDVGGGNGGMMTAILKANTRLKGTIAELPHVVEHAKERIAEAGLTERCECVPVDMFESVPASDAYILGNVIHDWDDERSITILSNCRKAMPDDGRVLLVELVLTPGNEFHLGKLIDVEMLVMTDGGLERTEAGYQKLFESAGLRLHAVHETPTPWSIVEARMG